MQKIQKELDEKSAAIKELRGKLKKEKETADYYRKYVETYIDPEIAMEVLSYDKTVSES